MNIDEALKHAEWLTEVALPAQGALTNLGSGFVTLAEEVERLRAEVETLEAKQEVLLASETDLTLAVERLRAENAELRMSVATMACSHKGIGLPDCRICDSRTKPGAGT